MPTTLYDLLLKVVDRTDVNDAVNILNTVTPIRIHITANPRANGVDGVRSPYLMIKGEKFSYYISIKRGNMGEHNLQIMFRP